MNDILINQLALDYCCTESDVKDSKNHFTIYTPLEGRRRYNNDDDCFLKITVVNGKVLFCGKESIIEQCKARFESKTGEWFFEAPNLCILNDMLSHVGYKIMFVHPFFVSEKTTNVNTGGYTITRYDKADIEQFRGDDRFDEAFAFCEKAPDMLGYAAISDGKILGMSGASCDSPTMWQIGINVMPEACGKGIGTMLVTVLKNEILETGRLPFYGTSMSHIASQRVALAAGFAPAWCELAVTRISGS